MFFKTKDQTDLRRTHLEPAEEMLHRGRFHFSKTLTEATRFLAEAGLLASSPEPLLDRISHNSDEVDKRFLRLEHPLPVPRRLQVNLPVSGQHPVPAVPVAALFDPPWACSFSRRASI